MKIIANRKSLNFLSYTTMCVLLPLMLLITACEEPGHKPRSALKNLADDVGDFQKPIKGEVIKFPAAHNPKENFQQEWWYLTANLMTENGQSLATQWTLFRRAVEDKHWYFAHAALANEQEHYSAYRSARAELGNIIFENKPFQAKIDEWSWQSFEHFLSANLQYGGFIDGDNSSNEQSKWQVDLTLSVDLNSCSVDDLIKQQFKLDVSEYQHFYPRACYFLQGEKGFSQKHQYLNIASYYYSQPFVEVEGKVFWQNKWQKVTGQAWFDREWGSQMLAEEQQGWDWFSLRLDENTALMVYQIRSDNDDFRYGSIMQRNGKIHTLSYQDIEIKNVSEQNLDNNRYPEQFLITIEKEKININVRVINNKQIMRFGIEYFEGMVDFSGSHTGTGFLEMTGYQDN